MGKAFNTVGFIVNWSLVPPKIIGAHLWNVKYSRKDRELEELERKTSMSMKNMFNLDREIFYVKITIKSMHTYLKNNVHIF